MCNLESLDITFAWIIMIGSVSKFMTYFLLAFIYIILLYLYTYIFL